MAMALPSTPDQKPSAAHFDSIIRIKVGKDEQVFEIYKGVLKFYSGYFSGAIDNIDNGRFKEAEENMITLPEEEPDIFKLFKDWLYTRELPNDNGDTLVKLWAFADRRIVPLLQNEAINAIQRHNYEEWQEACAILVYEQAGPGSALRRFLICSHAACVNNMEDTSFSAWPEEFRYDLLKHMLTEHPRYQPVEFEKRDMCEWHVHEEGVSCKKD